jgi:PKD repeat protein
MNNFYTMMQGRIPKLLLIPVIWALVVQTSYAQTNIAPFADAFATPTTGMAPLTVTFDGSGSYDPDGTIVDYQWNSSDGQTASGDKASLTFRAAGAYDIDLVVVDDFGSVNINTAQQTIKVTLAADSKPPIANFTATPTTGTAPLTINLDATESSDPDGKIVEYQWNSSDGQTASGRDATMTFDLPGSYEISLVVKDNNGLISTNSAQQTINVTAKPSPQPPIAKFTATPTTGTAPLTVNLDASESSDQDGKIVEYQWNTSDGQTASGRDATMTFDVPGSYEISLVVKDNDGLISTNSAQHTINVTAKPSPQPPIAKFTATSTTGTAPLTINLDATESSDPDGKIVEYQWNSSDGQTASGRDATITFNSVGTYKISLVVKDNDGLISTNSAQHTINVTAKPSPQPPIAKFTATPTTGTAPLTINLDASDSSDQDGKIVEYQWNSSDGQTASGRDATMTFDSVGTYKISLVVKDNDGLISTNSAQQTINVTAKPSLQPPVAKFTATPTTGTAPLTVKLDASDSSDQDGEIVEYQWNTSDGQTALGRNATMTFDLPGSYEISLVVKDNDGLISTNTAQQMINVTTKPSPQPPVAKFTATPTTGTAPLTVQLDASDSSDPDGEITEYQWKSSDGQTALGRDATMTFDLPGSYEISLAVKDNDGLTDSISLSVVVHKSACTAPPSNMVAWWPLDEGATATDIAGSNHGTYTGSFGHATGVVDHAVSLDGESGYVEVPDNPSLNFGTGDFSIDAWIFHKPDNSSGVQVILDKRENSASGTIGYSFYLYNGQLGFQLADGVGATSTCETYPASSPPGASCTNYIVNGPNLADGLWHHVAVTVKRDNSLGGRFYIDGIPQGAWIVDGDPQANFDTSRRNGSLNNNGPLRIGSRSFSVTGLYQGGIDEVELFNRALTESEIQDIYNAGAAGKCKDFILMPWDRRPCKGQNSVNVAATVCNYLTAPQTYQLSSVLPSTYHSQCNFTPTPPLINYNVSPTQLTVLPGQCNSFTVQIDVPAGLTASDTACYTATVNNVTAGHNLSNEGSILGTTGWCVVGPPDMAFQTLDLSEPTSVTLNITNTGDTAKTLDYTLIPVRSDMDESREASLSINGQEPGIGVSDKLFLNSGETGQINLTAALTQRDSFSVAEAILMTDVDGDGHQEPLYSTAFLYKTTSDDDEIFSEIRFEGLKNAYDIGDTLTITVAESSATSRSERVDLWVAAQIPTGEFAYITSSPSEPFSLEPRPFKTGITPSETVHSVFEFQVPPGMQGKYLLYALYAQEGSNPLVTATVWRSNLMSFSIWLAQCLPATYTQSSGLLHFPTVKIAGEPVQVFEANLQLDSLPRVFKFIDATPLPDNAATRAECPIFEPSTGQLHVPAAITTEGSQTIELELQLESPTSLRFKLINVTPNNLSTLF